MKFVIFYAICLHYLLSGILKIEDPGLSNQFCCVVVMVIGACFIYQIANLFTRHD